MSVRMLRRDEWEKKLRSYGCYPQDGLTKLNTGEWWRWPWKGAPFVIPCEADGAMDDGAFLRLIADMSSLAPPSWDFPDPFHT